MISVYLVDYIFYIASQDNVMSNVKNHRRPQDFFQGRAIVSFQKKL